MLVKIQQAVLRKAEQFRKYIRGEVLWKVARLRESLRRIDWDRVRERTRRFSRRTMQHIRVGLIHSFVHRLTTVLISVLVGVMLNESFQELWKHWKKFLE